MAIARGSSQVGQLVPPYAKVDGLTGGEVMGQSWRRFYTLPLAESPALGNGKPCVRMGRTGSILLGLSFQPVPCTVEPRATVLVWGITYVCDNASEFVDPSSYGADKAAQIKCALKGLRDVVATVSLTVDDGPIVDLHVGRYLICSPQQKGRIPAGHPFGLPPGAVTLTACGWVGWLRALPPGEHTIRTETTWTDGSEPEVISLVINVVRPVRGT